MKRVTLRIPDDLHAQAEARAKADRRSLNWVLVEAVRLMFESQPAAKPSKWERALGAKKPNGRTPKTITPPQDEDELAALIGRDEA
jgi:hypothetical protein